MPIRQSVKQSLNKLIGKVEFDVEIDPSEHYEHLEWGTRLDDLLMIPLLVTAYLPIILPLIGIRLPSGINIWVLVGGIVAFVFGSMVKTTWLAQRVQANLYFKTTARFPRGKTKVIQWTFSKDASNDTSVYRMDVEQYKKLEPLKKMTEAEQALSDTINSLVNAPKDNESVYPLEDEAGKRKWIPYIFNRKKNPAIILMPFTIGQLDFMGKDVVEAGQTTNGSRAEGTIYFIQQAMLTDLEGSEPIVFDVFKVVESQVHYEQEERIQRLSMEEVRNQVTEVDRGMSIPLTSVIHNQSITIKNLEEQLEDAQWNARKESNKRLKDMITALNLVQPKTEVREDWVQWAVVLAVLLVAVFIIGKLFGWW